MFEAEVSASSLLSPAMAVIPSDLEVEPPVFSFKLFAVEIKMQVMTLFLIRIQFKYVLLLVILFIRL